MTTQSEHDYNAALSDARKATQVAQDLADHYRAQFDKTRDELERCKRQLAAHEQPAPRPIDTVAISRMIVQLHDQRGLSFDQISARIHHDFGISISRAAVWQRYKRETRET